MVQFTKDSIVLTIPTQSPFETWTQLLNSGYAVMENLLTIDQIQKPSCIPMITHLLFELSEVESKQMMEIQNLIRVDD